MGIENSTDYVALEQLHEKVKALLEFYKQPLLQVLRYWDEESFVPQIIETPVKYIIKNFDKLPAKCTFEEYTIEKKDSTHFLVTDFLGMIHEIGIREFSTEFSQYGVHRDITYRGKHYEDLLLSGNSYYHMLSQGKKIEEWTKIDVQAGDMTQLEAKQMQILNDFHDIVEYKEGDTVCTSKEDYHRKQEASIADKLIHDVDWSDQEKEMMKAILKHEHKSSLFKLYERMFYLVDINNLMIHADKYHKPSYLAGGVLGRGLPTFFQEYAFMNGTKKKAYDIASFRDHFTTYIPLITKAFTFVDQYGIDDKRVGEYENSRNLFPNLIMLASKK